MHSSSGIVTVTKNGTRLGSYIKFKTPSNDNSQPKEFIQVENRNNSVYFFGEASIIKLDINTTTGILIEKPEWKRSILHDHRFPSIGRIIALISVPSKVQ